MILGHKKIYNSLSFCQGDLSGLGVGNDKVFYFPHLIGLQKNDKDIVLSDGQYYYEPIVSSLNGEHQLGFFKKLWRGIKRKVRKVGKFIGKVAGKVVKGVKRIGRKVWKGVKTVARKTWTGIKNAGKFLYKKVLPIVKKVVKVVAPILSFVPGPIGLIAAGVDLVFSLIPDPKDPSKKIPVQKKVTKMVKGRKVARTGKTAKISQMVPQDPSNSTRSESRRLQMQRAINERQKRVNEAMLKDHLDKANKQLEVLDKEVKKEAQSKKMSIDELMSIVKSASKTGLNEWEVIKNIKAFQLNAKDVQNLADQNAKANAMVALEKGIYKEDFHKLAKLQANVASQGTAQKKDTETYAQLTAQKHTAGKIEKSELENLVKLESKANGLTAKQISDFSKLENTINADTIATKSEIENTTKKALQLARYQALISENKKQTNSKTNNNLLMYGAVGLLTLIMSSNS